MSRLNASEPALHLVAVLQTTCLDGFGQSLESVFHSARKPTPYGFLFFLPSARPAQDISLLALWDRHLLHVDFLPDLQPVILEQLFFKLLHLAPRRAHQILAASFADRRKILLAHNAAVKHPDAACLAVLTFHHAQDCFHRRDIRTVAVESFVTEREPLAVDDQRDHHLLAVGTMIARVAAAHHGIAFRRSFHVGARQIVKQYIERGAEQLAVALLQMLLQFRFVRQNAVQAAVEPCVIDLAVFDPQQVVQCCRWIPSLLNRQFAAWRAQAIDRQHSGYATRDHGTSACSASSVCSKKRSSARLPKLQAE